MTLLRSIASEVVKLIAAVGALDTEFAASRAVALQNSVALIGRSVVGMKPVSLTPSGTVAVTVTGLNAADAASSNRYVIAPAGPVRVAFLTRNAGRALVAAPASGAIGTGTSIAIAGPIVNFLP